MRSRSSRCAIERIERRGLPSGVWSRRATSSGSPSVQAAKPGEASRLLSVIASACAVLRREEGLEVEHADALERRALHAADQLGEIEVAALAPGRLEHAREQDVLAAAQRIRLDAEQREQARGRRGHALLAARSASPRCAPARRRERAQHRERPARAAARACRARGPTASRRRAMRAPSWPHVGEPLPPLLRDGARVLVRAPAGALGLGLVDPRPEVLGRERGEGEQQVPEVALRVDGDGRDAVDGGLFEQADAEPGLAAPGHAETHRVRGEVLGVDEQRLGSDRRRRPWSSRPR